jgi:SOS-response transcriptional repressor LexA
MLSGRRPISEKAARKYEKMLSLTEGWFDISEAENTISYTPDLTGYVPLISWVKAGAWHEAEDQFAPGDADDYLTCPASHGEGTFALRVEGDSMTAPYGKSYPPGCIIFVDPGQRGGVVSGDRVIAKLNGYDAVTFKVFIEDSGNRFLRALNPQYPPIVGEFRILGKVIGKWEPE